jgi:signal transduction histidine kinase
VRDARPDARIDELEAELNAARKTIRALLDKIEHLEAMPGEADAGLTRGSSPEVERSAARDAIDLELRHRMADFDKVVRQRNRALVESETQLRRKNDELRRMNELKTEFISIAAHELRTPLTSIVGYLDLMIEGAFGKLGASLVKPVEMARRNSNRLVRLVEEMLDLSRIEAGRVTLHRERCDLADIVREVVAALAPVAARSHHDLEVAIVEPPLFIDADRARMAQVATNLLVNAIRYSPGGTRIEVGVDRAPSEQVAGGWARLRVRHGGPGIPRAQRDLMFEPFSDIGTAKHHTSSVPDSAGLGLYIARGLVDLHGGIVSVDSREGAFTELTVLLPMAP